MNEDSKNFLAVLGIPVFIVLLFIVLVPIGLFNAFVVLKLYGWFLVPLGAPVIGLLNIWGISILIQHYTTNTDYKKREKGDISKTLVSSVLGSAFALLIGFIIKSLM